MKNSTPYHWTKLALLHHKLLVSHETEFLSKSLVGNKKMRRTHISISAHKLSTNIFPVVRCLEESGQVKKEETDNCSGFFNDWIFFSGNKDNLRNITRKVSRFRAADSQCWEEPGCNFPIKINERIKKGMETWFEEEENLALQKGQQSSIPQRSRNQSHGHHK